MANVLVVIRGVAPGFLASIAELLAADHTVTIIVTSASAERALRLSFPALRSAIAVRSDAEVHIPQARLLDECARRESLYGERFAMIAGFDRALGKGYIFNADRHPNVDRSYWPPERKAEAVLREFIYWEGLFEEFAADVVVSKAPSKVMALIARHRQIKCLGIVPARLGTRYIWADDEYLQSKPFAAAVRKFLDTPLDPASLPHELPQNLSRARHATVSYSLRSALHMSAVRVYRETYARLRATAASLKRRRRPAMPQRGYRYLGWVPSMVRRPIAYRYFERHGVTPERLAGKRIVYAPLHLEPEVALLAISPEFNNSMEMIAWVSKSLPMDAVIVVKEQPFSFGIRSMSYYDNFRKMPNVVLAAPEVGSWDWVRASSLVATITGTAGFEAVYFERPVVSFGAHQVINQLPTVRYASNFESTRSAIDALLGIPSGDDEFLKSKAALYRAQLDVSFDLPGLQLDNTWAPHHEFAMSAVKQLLRCYPDLLRVG